MSTMIIGCPICDEPLCSAPPNYDAVENMQAQGQGGGVAAGEPVAPTPAGRSRSRKAAVTKVKGPKSEVIATHCGHMFHVACLEQWFKNSNARTCPSCRKLCPLTKIVTIFPVILEQEQLNVSAAAPAGTSAIPRGATIPVITLGGGQAAGNPVSSGVGDPTYKDLFVTHQTLLVDFHEIEVKLGDQVDENAMKEGIIKSYESAFAENATEIANLKHELEAYRAVAVDNKDDSDVQKKGKKRSSAKTSAEPGGSGTSTTAKRVRARAPPRSKPTVQTP